MVDLEECWSEKDSVTLGAAKVGCDDGESVDVLTEVFVQNLVSRWTMVDGSEKRDVRSAVLWEDVKQVSVSEDWDNSTT